MTFISDPLSRDIYAVSAILIITSSDTEFADGFLVCKKIPERHERCKCSSVFLVHLVQIRLIDFRHSGHIEKLVNSAPQNLHNSSRI